MKKIKIYLSIVLIATLAACKSPNKQDENSQNQVYVQDTHNAENSLDWVGVYKGYLPCASCEEIKTTLVLKDNNTFERTEIYVKGGQDETFIEEGTFTWDKDKTIITLNLKNEKNQPKYMVTEGRLIMLDSNGKENQGELADKYILNKVKH